MRLRLLPLFIAAALLISATTLRAEESEAPQKKQSTRSKMIFGPPVNVNMAGPGSLPDGLLLTAINASFADRVTAFGNSKAPDAFGQAWFLKVRYGITDYLEVWSTTPYINNRLSNPEPKTSVIEGIGDNGLGLTVSALHERRGDPITLSASAGVMVPIAAYGKTHMPGFGVWGFRGQAAIGKFVTKDIKIETEGVFNTRFDRGNQDVRIGDQFQWNSQVRYLFDWADFGVESIFIRQFANDKEVKGRTVDLRNGLTEWFVGPSVNVAITPLDMWVGVGVFFPVMQYTESPAKVENVRFEFKIGKTW